MADNTQQDWKFCLNCSALWFNPRDNPSKRGVCPNPKDSNGGHVPKGHNFILPHAGSDNCGPDTEKTQSLWRFCNKCSVMFFEGTHEVSNRHCAGNEKGVGIHEEAGLCFTLPINRQGGPILNPADKTHQRDWRFCGKCTTMFFDGDLNNKGVCPAPGGGAHVALPTSDFFVLPFIAEQV
jgi:hypothetical protein